MVGCEGLSKLGVGRGRRPIEEAGSLLTNEEESGSSYAYFGKMLDALHNKTMD